MNMPYLNLRSSLMALAGGWLALGSVLAAEGQPSVINPVSSTENPPAGFLYRTNYKGWSDAIWMSNGKVEAFVVPSIGRVIQFRFAGAKDGPFWENEALLGQPADPKSPTWRNFGGDKVWPAPERRWDYFTPTNWPPPVGFDATPFTASSEGWTVTLTSPVDPYYGIRVTRRIELDVHGPAMHIDTTFQKVRGQTLDVSIWVLTQLKEPLGIYARIPADSKFAQGFVQMSDRRPPSVQVRRNILSLQRDPKERYKIGLEAGALVWLGPDYLLRIDSPRHIFDPYPDDGASSEVLTSPDPEKYVQLEMLGALVQMRVGQEVTRRSTYTLLPRTELDPELEIRKQLPP